MHKLGEQWIEVIDGKEHMLKAVKPVELPCAIGDREIDGMPYSQIVDIARNFIEKIGGFEKFAEWGLLR